MASDKLISIIVPVYNCEKYIKRAILSLVNQTYKNLQMVIIDDGSVDNTNQILEEYSKTDSRILLLKQNHKGQAAARNLGLLYAKGDYIMFLDSDDWYKSTMCEKMVNTIDKNGVDLAICNTSLEYENNCFRLYRTMKSGFSSPVGKFEIKNQNFLNTKFVLWNKIFKKSLIDKYNIVFKDLTVGEDALFCFEYFCICNFAFGIIDRLYNYNIRKNSIMDYFYKKKYPKKNIEVLRIFEYLYNFLKENNIEKKFESEFIAIFSKRIIFCLKNANQNDKYEIIKLANDIIKATNLKYPKGTLLNFIQNNKITQAEQYIKKTSNQKLLWGKRPLTKKIIKIIDFIKKAYLYFRIKK